MQNGKGAWLKGGLRTYLSGCFGGDSKTIISALLWGGKLSTAARIAGEGKGRTLKR